MKITRANVSTRNKCFPLDFTSSEICLVPETEGEEAESGLQIGLSNDDCTFETLKPPNLANCFTRLQITPIFGKTPKSTHNFQVLNSNRDAETFAAKSNYPSNEERNPEIYIRAKKARWEV